MPASCCAARFSPIPHCPGLCRVGPRVLNSMSNFFLSSPTILRLNLAAPICFSSAALDTPGLQVLLVTRWPHRLDQIQARLNGPRHTTRPHLLW